MRLARDRLERIRSIHGGLSREELRSLGPRRKLIPYILRGVVCGIDEEYGAGSGNLLIIMKKNGIAAEDRKMGREETNPVSERCVTQCSGNLRNSFSRDAKLCTPRLAARDIADLGA